MDSNLQKALEKFVLKAKGLSSKGKTFSKEEILQLQEKIGVDLPDWYKNMLLNYPITGLEIEIQEQDTASKRPIEIANFEQIIWETMDAYPGLEGRKFGYINFGSCLEGSGDSIFINLLENGNPAIVRLYHDKLLTDRKLENGGGHIITNSLSEFLDKATVFEIPDFSESE